MGAFFSSLMGSYSGAMREKHKEDRDKEDKRVDAQLEVLKLAVRDPSITQEAREAAFEQMEELTSGKGKKKSGFSFKNLLGKFGDVGQQQGKTLEQRTGERQSQGAPKAEGGPGGEKGGATVTPTPPQ